MSPFSDTIVIIYIDMFEEIELPKKLGKDTINEAILDIRIEQQIDEQGVAKLVADFLHAEIKETSILTLPVNVRETDTRLRYTPAYKIIKDGILIGIGLHNLFFDCIEKYPGWDTFITNIYNIIQEINKNELFCKYNIVKFVLRYIDVFEEEINKCCAVHFQFRDKNIDNTYSFSTKMKEDDFNILVNIGSYKESKSVVDIGVYKDVPKICLKDFYESQSEIVKNSHLISKRYFFGLLTDEFLKSLDPDFEEED